MATVPSTPFPRENGYPTTDRRSFDSDWHRDLMFDLIQTLQVWYAGVRLSGRLRNPARR